MAGKKLVAKPLFTRFKTVSIFTGEGRSGRSKTRGKRTR